ncbi:unnamed protein product [Amoebophrya sp. A120]|nr:unnamed protein product [Amoebophrya sp. A120]|eukprot:GSA120T00008373001.1
MPIKGEDRFRGMYGRKVENERTRRRDANVVTGPKNSPAEQLAGSKNYTMYIQQTAMIASVCWGLAALLSLFAAISTSLPNGFFDHIEWIAGPAEEFAKDVGRKNGGVWLFVLLSMLSLGVCLLWWQVATARLYFPWHHFIVIFLHHAAFSWITLYFYNFFMWVCVGGFLIAPLDVLPFILLLFNGSGNFDNRTWWGACGKMPVSLHKNREQGQAGVGIPIFSPSSSPAGLQLQSGGGQHLTAEERVARDLQMLQQQKGPVPGVHQLQGSRTSVGPPRAGKESRSAGSQSMPSSEAPRMTGIFIPGGAMTQSVGMESTATGSGGAAGVSQDDMMSGQYASSAATPLLRGGSGNGATVRQSMLGGNNA